MQNPAEPTFPVVLSSARSPAAAATMSSTAEPFPVASDRKTLTMHAGLGPRWKSASANAR